MVSEHKSPHGANNHQTICSATLTLNNDKDENLLICDFQEDTHTKLPTKTADLMSKQLNTIYTACTSSIENYRLENENNNNHQKESTIAEDQPTQNETTSNAEPQPTATLTPVHNEEQNLLVPPTSKLCQKITKSANAASGRSAALEQAYVHDVYEKCEEPTGPIRPRVAHFLSSLDCGSVVCDVGCGNGRYLTQCNPSIVTIGVDRCHRLSKEARERSGEVLVCDNLELPFCNNSFDAVLSLAVIHHFASTERRVSALRELARVLRVGGRVIISVWAMEQRHRRFESQDVLIPWQPPKNRPMSYSDEEEDDDFLPPYNAYTEESTNSSRSAGDGDSSSLSSSSPGESCYSFVRRAIQKLAGRKHNWFLDSWTSKDTKNDSSLDYEDAKDLPIELRRLDDFEDFTEPPLSAGLKSRSLGSILNPPPRQIVRSRSSVPSLGGPLYLLNDAKIMTTQNLQFITTTAATTQDVTSLTTTGTTNTMTMNENQFSPTHLPIATTTANGNICNGSVSGSANGINQNRHRPKLIKQKQSLCDEDYQQQQQSEQQAFHMISNYNSTDNSITNSLHKQRQSSAEYTKTQYGGSTFLRKQSSLNEELMTGNRLRDKEHVRKRIQKQNSLNEAFLCRSAMFGKRLQIIREGFTSTFKTSTKNGLNKIMQNIKNVQMTNNNNNNSNNNSNNNNSNTQNNNARTNKMQEQNDNNLPNDSQMQNQHCQHHQHQHHHHYYQASRNQKTNNIVSMLQRQFSTVTTINSNNNSNNAKYTGGPVTFCNSAECLSGACYCNTYQHGCTQCLQQGEHKLRRHSRESGSDSSKDSSLQSDTSVESEDSFASVIFIPKSELQQQQQQSQLPQQQQQQQIYKQQHANSNSSSSNSSSSNGGCQFNNINNNNNNNINSNGSCCYAKILQTKQQQPINCIHNNGQQQQQYKHHHHHNINMMTSGPTSPLIMPCPPTPAHSPAAAQISCMTSPPQSVAAVAGAMALLTPPNLINNNNNNNNNKFQNEIQFKTQAIMDSSATTITTTTRNCFNFDELHLKQQQQQQQLQEVQSDSTCLQKQQTKNPFFEAQQEENETTSKFEIQTNPFLDEEKQTDVKAKTKIDKEIEIEKERKLGKITRQTIRDLPPIPVFRKQQSLQMLRPSFPIVRRSSASGASVASNSLAKLLTLELFNPATDDLDSDSSEASTPDSIDSVISAHYHSNQSINDEVPDETVENIENLNMHTSSSREDIIPKMDLPKSQKSLKPRSKEECAEFAEQLSAKLLACEEHKSTDFITLENVGDVSEYFEDNSSADMKPKKRTKDELNDILALREELRDRRLMLANLSTQQSQQQSPTSSTSTSSLSSQTRSSYDDVDGDRSYMLQLYDNCKISKYNCKRNRQYNLHSETAYLLQDDSDYSAREDFDELEHDVILEEDEDAAEDETEDQNKLISSAVALEPENEQVALESGQVEKNLAKTQKSKESWENSNSSNNSLDSPSQGGALTHHRYYHVFREGELDALINNHVSNLHIVSSYYERASWCVVAEKVQVWTI